VPELSQLTFDKARRWALDSDHLKFIDVDRRQARLVGVGVLHERAKLRDRQVREWRNSPTEERKMLARGAAKLLDELVAITATEEAFEAYYRKFTDDTLRAQVAHAAEDGVITSTEYEYLVGMGQEWDRSADFMVGLIREKLREFQPPAPPPPAPAPSAPPPPVVSEKTWTPLFGKFRTAPASLGELHAAMVQEVPTAHELLFDKMLSFYLSQQREPKLAQVADAVARDYDRRESLGVWHFLWNTGYKKLHLLGLPPVETLPQLVTACGGRTEALQDAIKNGQLGLWATTIARAEALALLVKPHRGGKDVRDAARRALWLAGDVRLQLSSGPVVSNLRELETAMLASEANAGAAVAELQSGALTTWLRGLKQTALADGLDAITAGQATRDALFARYVIIWASGSIKTLPLWRSNVVALQVETPRRFDSLSPNDLQTLVTLLDAGVLNAWATSVLREPALAETWSRVKSSYAHAPLSLRVATLRWSAGASGVLTAAGQVNEPSQLFSVFEKLPGEVQRLYAEGVLEEWRNVASLWLSPAASRVKSLPQPLQAIGYLWCLGYRTFPVGDLRVTSLAELAQLPDADQPALASLIQSGALALWREVHFPDQAHALATPLEVEDALLACGAPPATLELSASAMEFGSIAEGTQQSQTLTLSAAGLRGRITALLSTDHDDITLSCNGMTHSRGGPPLVIGPLWAAAQTPVTVHVEVTATPGRPPGGGIHVQSTHGLLKTRIPLAWTPEFPTAQMMSSGILGGLGAGLVAALLRPALGYFYDPILYDRPGTSFSDQGVAMVMRSQEGVSFGTVFSASYLPGIASTLVACVLAFRAAKRSGNADNAAALGCVTLVVGGPIITMIIGYFLKSLVFGVDMVGHRLREIAGSNMALTSSGALGWIFVFVLIGASLGLGRVLRLQARVALARSVVALPFALFALILLT